MGAGDKDEGEMTNMIEPSLFLAFIAGILTVTTPCIIPILPPMLAGSIGHRLRPLFIVLGSMVTFTLMGGLFSVIGIAAGEHKEVLRFTFMAVIIGFGLVMVDENINRIYTRYSSKLVNGLLSHFGKGNSLSKEGHPLFSAFILGLSLGIVWIPCVGPILGSVLMYATYQGELISGSILLLTYSIGLGIPLLGIAYGGKYTSKRVNWTKKNSTLIRRLAGWVLIITGVAMFFGVDQLIQSNLIPYFPDYELYILQRLGLM